MSEPRPGQRIDRWLWHARLAKTRTLAARLAASGQVRVNRRRVDRASQLVRVGDVLTLARHGGVRIVRVAELAERRGPASQAQALYEEIGTDGPAPADPGAPATAKPAPAARREPGAGRPTKRDRRAMIAFAKGRD